MTQLDRMLLLAMGGGIGLATLATSTSLYLDLVSIGLVLWCAYVLWNPRLMHFDLTEFLAEQRVWSQRTFGPGDRTAGVLDHIAKEMVEVAQHPTDLEEWIDIVILALDGAWRSGHSPDQIASMLRRKFNKNKHRTWPDWRLAQFNDKAIEHIKESPDVR